MARMIEGSLTDGTGKDRYPWNQWADGHIWEVKRGEDYFQSTATSGRWFMGKPEGSEKGRLLTKSLRTYCDFNL